MCAGPSEARGVISTAGVGEEEVLGVSCINGTTNRKTKIGCDCCGFVRLLETGYAVRHSPWQPIDQRRAGYIRTGDAEL